MRKSSLIGKIVVTFSSTVGLFLAVLGVVLYLEVDSTFTDFGNNLGQQVVSARADEIGTYLSLHLEALRVLGENPELRTGDPDRIQAEIRTWERKLHPQYQALFFAFLNGRALTHDGDEMNVADLAVFNNAISGSNPHSISDALPSPIDGQPIFIVARPVRGASGRLVGVLGASIRLETLSEIARSMDFQGFGYGWIVNERGTYMAHPNAELLQTTSIADLDSRGYLGLPELGRQILAEPRGQGQVVNPENRAELMVWAEIPSSPEWRIGLTIPVRELFAPALRMLTFIALGCVVLLAAVVLAAFLLGKVITRPILDMDKLLAQIAQGGGDLRTRIQVRTRDELAAMARNFNEFIERLVGIVASIRASTEKVQTMGLDLRANANETSAAVTQISANIDSVRDRVLHQSSSVVEITATVEEITSNIQSLNRSIDTQAEQVAQSSSAIEQMVASIHSVSKNLDGNSLSIAKLVQTTEQGGEHIETMVHTVQDIVAKSEGLAETNRVIQTIASQTNLLAMNAAIEAAHAGDQGRGFAVVADEIRKLAEHSAAQSKQIGSVLKDVLRGIEEVTKKVNLTQETFVEVLMTVGVVDGQEREIRHSMEEQAAGGTQVLEGLNKINQITSEVRSGSAEMQSGGQTILEEMLRLRSITEEITQSMSEMAGGVAEIRDAILGISRMTDANEHEAESLTNEVGRFVID